MTFCKGATRWVFLVGRYAFKIPAASGWESLLVGLLANIQESRIGRSYQRPDDRFCPVLWADPFGLLVVMPRCELLGRRMSHAEYQAFVKHKDYRVPVENKPDSFGWLNGRIVAIDYGS